MAAERFWLVWTPNGSNPCFRHSAESLARTEAERLARRAPGQEFFVVEAKSLAQVTPPPSITVDLAMPIPF